MKRDFHVRFWTREVRLVTVPRLGHLFSIMMLESKLSNFSKNSLKYFPVGVIFGSIFLILLFYEISLFFESNYNLNYFYLNIYQN